MTPPMPFLLAIATYAIWKSFWTAPTPTKPKDKTNAD